MGFFREILGVEPWAKQIEILEAVRDSSRVAVKSGHKVSKLLALSTPVPTLEGWSTIGDLAPGDQVFDERGEPCTVRGLSEVIVGGDCYEVEFDDGTTIVTDATHAWKTRTHDGARRTTTEAIRDDLHRGQARHWIATTAPVLCKALAPDKGAMAAPRAFLRGSVAQRRAMLARMAGDESSRPTAETVCELAASLGYVSRLVLLDDGGAAIRVDRRSQREIVAVRSVPSVPVRCIEVDSPSRLFLVSEAFIPTHNRSLRRRLGALVLLLVRGRPGGHVLDDVATGGPDPLARAQDDAGPQRPVRELQRARPGRAQDPRPLPRTRR